ncbi:MAG: hypothetical protein AAGA54_37025 [Myxococcota bacterium]
MQSPSTSTVTFDRTFLDEPYRRRQVGNWLRGWNGGRSNQTRGCRSLDLHYFAAFALGEKSIPKPKNRDDIRAALVLFGVLRGGQSATIAHRFIETRRHDDAPSTLIRRMKTLRSLANYLHSKDSSLRIRDALPMPTVSSLEARPSDVDAEESELQDLPIAARPRAQYFLQSRDHTIVSLHTNAALPPSVLQDLNWSAVDFVDSPATSNAPPTPARVRIPRNNGQTHARRLGHYATSSLLGWADTYTRRFGGRLPDRPVFVSLSGARLSPSRLYQIVDA